jgi:hypothetical protein
MRPLSPASGPVWACLPSLPCDCERRQHLAALQGVQIVHADAALAPGLITP